MSTCHKATVMAGQRDNHEEKYMNCLSDYVNYILIIFVTFFINVLLILFLGFFSFDKTNV